MNFLNSAKNLFLRIFGEIKSIILCLAVVALLQATGVISSMPYYGQWALINSGFNDADTLAAPDEEAFDYRFMIKDLEGHRIPFEKFKNKVVFLNLWATWCRPCRAEMAGIQSLYEKIDTAKVVFVMLSIDRDADLDKVVSYVKKEKFTFKSYMPTGYLPEQLKVPYIPTTFILTPDGKIARKEVGGSKFDTNKFQKFLEGLSDKKQ